MKKFLIQMIVAIGFSSFAFSANAGIPVIDAASIAKLVIEYEQQVEQYAKQLDQFEKQLEQLTTEQGALNAITGGRGMGSLIDTQSLRQQVPTTVFNDLSTSAGAQAAVDQAQQQLTSTQNRITMLQTLTDSINTTADAKASTDLQARIAAENARLMNEQIMLQAGKDNQAAKAAVQAKINKDQAQQYLLGTDSPGFE